MQGYASKTGTKRNLEVMRKHDWGILISPYDPYLPEGFNHMCLDNGAWTAHTKGIDWDQKLFEKALAKFGASADFVVAPDIHQGGASSLALSKAWISPLLNQCKKVLIPIQDGMSPDEISPLLSERVGIFLAGSFDYRWRHVAMWGHVAKSTACHFHVAIVNSIKRMETCQIYGVHSFDGSGPSRFASKAELMGKGLITVKKQPSLLQ